MHPTQAISARLSRARWLPPHPPRCPIAGRDGNRPGKCLPRSPGVATTTRRRTTQRCLRTPLEPSSFPCWSG
eukprot:15432431-Alexandrium_andersonii.AAC.1